jgi:hypothetical protein
MAAAERIPVRLDFEIWPGTLGPLQETPPRRAGSVRRTTSVHSTWPGGFAGPFVAVCTGRDLLTRADGEARTSGSAAVTLTTEADSKVVAAVDDRTLQALVGVDLGRGFRRAAAAVTEPGALLATLLDDAPAAALVSGSSRIRAEAEATGSLPAATARMALPVVCVGRRDGGMARSRAAGRPLLGQGPPAGRLERDDDPLGWHHESALPLLAMRRRRRIDVWIADREVRVDSHFRDSRMDPDGVEASVHEYEVEMTARGEDLVVEHLTVRARTLPGPDCPGAVTSAQDVVGTPLAAMRATVRERLHDPHSCTHLDDQLRALADVPFLLAALTDDRSTGGA